MGTYVRNNQQVNAVDITRRHIAILLGETYLSNLGAYNKTFQSVTVKIDDETIRPTDGVKVMMIKGTLNYYSKYCNKQVETRL